MELASGAHGVAATGDSGAGSGDHVQVFHEGRASCADGMGPAIKRNLSDIHGEAVASGTILATRSYDAPDDGCARGHSDPSIR